MAERLNNGTILNSKYIIKDVLGQGNTGWVYLCEEQSEKENGKNTLVAIKEAAPAFCVRYGDSVYAESMPGITDYEQYFEQIKKTLSNEAIFLGNIPSLIHLIEEFEENNTLYIVMEYIQGPTLSDLTNRLLEDDVRAIGMIILKTLSLVHKHGYIHGDICPQNIIISNTIRLIDYGSVISNSSELHFFRNGYSPLEQLQERSFYRIGPWTDIYALGATLYKIATGVVLPSSEERLNGKKFPEPKELNQKISNDLNNKILKAVAMSPEDRYTTTKEMYDALSTDGNYKMKMRKAFEFEGICLIGGSFLLWLRRL